MVQSSLLRKRGDASVVYAVKNFANQVDRRSMLCFENWCAQSHKFSRHCHTSSHEYERRKTEQTSECKGTICWLPCRLSVATTGNGLCGHAGLPISTEAALQAARIASCFKSQWTNLCSAYLIIAGILSRHLLASRVTL